MLFESWQDTETVVLLAQLHVMAVPSAAPCDDGADASN